MGGSSELSASYLSRPASRNVPRDGEWVWPRHWPGDTLKYKTTSMSDYSYGLVVEVRPRLDRYVVKDQASLTYVVLYKWDYKLRHANGPRLWGKPEVPKNLEFSFYTDPMTGRRRIVYIQKQLTDVCVELDDDSLVLLKNVEKRETKGDAGPYPFPVSLPDTGEDDSNEGDTASDPESESK